MLPQVTLCSHPLIAHKMALLRDKTTDARQIRTLFNEIGLLLAVDSTRDISLIPGKVRSSPMANYSSFKVKESLGIFPILRAGLGLVESFQTILPPCHVHHLGLYRDRTTLVPVEYYNKLPAICNVELGIVLDPMVATAGTAIATVNILKEWGCTNIKFVCVLGSLEGLTSLANTHPDIQIYVGAIDDELSAEGYVIPGMGDAGDRQFRTEH